ncbi:MAG: NAD-dependent epimerase/dehydratase family protein [Acetobacteraceae bacterium]|nr:NAD-dependent epimerase/dehydratase family protein [Acetobacteraceae bacterium]
MKILLTGAAGFIGLHVARALLARGDEVVGIDNLNSYYDVRLKQARLAQLEGRPGFRFIRTDLAHRDEMAALASEHADVTHIVHLAAQAGVRYSMQDPYAYVSSNVLGHLAVLEFARHLPRLAHLVYASSSSVYGGNQLLPFAETDRVDTPLSLYAATKRADELMSYSYGHLYGLKQTGLRFFTVYGAWGRPDMAYFSFAEAIAAGRPITVYDDGLVRRDFTYIDDIVAGVVGVLDTPPIAAEPGPPVRVLNIGNHRSEPVTTLIGLLEEGLGQRALIHYTPRPAADVADTWADVDAIGALTGFAPTTPLSVGMPRFVEWFKQWRAMREGLA